MHKNEIMNSRTQFLMTGVTPIYLFISHWDKTFHTDTLQKRFCLKFPGVSHPHRIPVKHVWRWFIHRKIQNIRGGHRAKGYSDLKYPFQPFQFPYCTDIQRHHRTESISSKTLITMGNDKFGAKLQRIIDNQAKMIIILPKNLSC
jgi:hypothetical protein